MNVPKQKLTQRRRWSRFVLGIIDPRAWLHLVKLVNYYNHAHVAQMRQITRGPGCHISPTSTFAYGMRITLGARVLVGEECKLWAGPSTARVEIGDDTMLGPGVLITAASYRFRDGAPISAQVMDEADVQIGKDVWIGARATILAGSVIGDGAVIGAGSVVRGVIPAGQVAAGSPARVVAAR
jgi:acetyltransferase-like isoleucine patch superfamily enzyme